MQELQQPHSQGSGQAQPHYQQTGGQAAGGAAERGGAMGTAGAQQTGPARGSQGAGGTQQLFPSRNFLHEQVRMASVQALNQSLADAVVMHSQLLSAHWNVKGRNFYQHHELFEDLAEDLEGHIDALAERATALGGIARGSTYEAARESRLDPIPAETCEETALLEAIAYNLSQLDSELNWHMEAIEQQGDLDTVDLLNEVSRDVSEMLWFVEAHLQGAGRMQQSRGSAARSR